MPAKSFIYAKEIKYLANGSKGFPGSSVSKESVCQCRKPSFVPWVGKIPWRRKWQPTPVFLPGNPHRQRSLVGCSPRDLKESGTTERLTVFLISAGARNRDGVIQDSSKEDTLVWWLRTLWVTWETDKVFENIPAKTLPAWNKRDRDSMKWRMTLRIEPNTEAYGDGTSLN